MANSFDTSIGGMVNDLLEESGESFTYRRVGVTDGTVTFRKSQPVSMAIDASGMMIEMQQVDFIGLMASLPHGLPLRGDWLERGTEVYEVHATGSERPYRIINPTMIRIHTKQVSR